MEPTSQEKLLCAIAKILLDLNIEYFITGGMAVSVILIAGFGGGFLRALIFNAHFDKIK
jgi:hypothetical protein